MSNGEKGLQRSPDEPGTAAPDSPTKEEGMEEEVEGCYPNDSATQMKSLLFWVTRMINYSSWEWLHK